MQAHVVPPERYPASAMNGQHMDLETARAVYFAHCIPGFHAWSPSPEQGWSYEYAYCDECVAAQDIIGVPEALRISDDITANARTGAFCPLRAEQTT
jgi:hypothetical protein